ncbi:DUF3040 domain-containing protein [Actinomyces sp. oral taxon 180]|uniref:DUF3040 domain-containing protein n=1 Tax=Actinomyces sp. oral taxon 180 TaxID=651609 RepID=UPI0001F10424|nr:DUF3040 domain-containing protein [Actinomyces sp. oral taxon 180]EFU62190.1 conserved hypothetical protein [Actinomyces sp. oral taxon 180 str. F0310]
MALTEYEKKILEQMEASLREEDPALASQMSAPAPDDKGSARRAPRRLATGIAGAFLGMVVLVVAVSLGYSVLSIVIGVAGFALTVAGILYALARPSRRGSAAADGAASRKKSGRGGWDSFIQDQERRWDDRKGDD